MKTRLLQFLACPECSGTTLDLNGFSCDGDEVMDGALTCRDCGRTFPVIGGVPRMLPDALIGTLPDYHPEYFRRYAVPARTCGEQDEIGRTLTFYSYARAKLFTPQPEPSLVNYWQTSLRIRIPGVQDLGGQFGLDAGCGEGRYTYCLAESGAEVVGLDLSEAVNLAFHRNRGQPRAHIVQGSIYQPPFRRGIFDFVLSTGVLHHLPDPQRGFEALIPLLHAGGSMHVWVYGLRQMSAVYRLSHLTLLRRLGSRLSPRASYLLSVPLALALHVLLFLPVRLLAGFPLFFRRIGPQLRELAALPFWMHVAEVQDRIGVPVTHFPTRDEVRAWHERAGLSRVTVDPTAGGRGWSARGYRAAYQP